MLDEDIRQRWLGQLVTADDATAAQRLFHDQVGVEVGPDLHLDVILPAPGHLHSRKLLQPARLRVVIELEPRGVAPVLAFDLAHATLNDGLPLVDDYHVLAQFLDLLQLVRREDDGFAPAVHLFEGFFQDSGVDRIQAAEWLIHDQDQRVVQDSGQELDLLLVALGKFFDFLVAILRDLKALELLVQVLARGGLR